MKEYRCFQCRRTKLGRRDFLRAGSLSFLGMSAVDLLKLERLQAASNANPPSGQAQACILLFLEGGASQMDTWDPKGNTNFGSISTNVDGIRISELLPRTARHMDKLSLIRSMRTQETNHPQGTIESLTGHRPSPTMKFPGSDPSWPRKWVPETACRRSPRSPCPGRTTSTTTRRPSKARTSAPNMTPWSCRTPAAKNIVVPDLRLPKTDLRRSHRRSEDPAQHRGPALPVHPGGRPSSARWTPTASRHWE